MRLLLVFSLIGIVLAAIVVVTSVRILDERQLAFRTFLGDPESALLPLASELRGPMVYLHIPWLHQVDIYDRRVKRFVSEPKELQMDPENIQVGYYVVWRIQDVRKLRENLQPSQVLRVIDDKTYNAVRNELATRSLKDLLSSERDLMAQRIQRQADEELDKLGIEIVGVGFRQVEFLEGNLENVFARMRQDRERLAKKLRAEGEERAQQIRAEADRDGQILLARARKQAAKLRGEADAKSTEIYARAYNQDRDFYRFVRSLEAYRKGFDEQTTVVLSSGDPFLGYFFGDGSEAPATR